MLTIKTVGIQSPSTLGKMKKKTKVQREGGLWVDLWKLVAHHGRVKDFKIHSPKNLGSITYMLDNLGLVIHLFCCNFVVNKAQKTKYLSHKFVSRIKAAEVLRPLA